MIDVARPISSEISVKHLLRMDASEKINPQRDSNRGPLVNEKILRSEHSTTELAGPGLNDNVLAKHIFGWQSNFFCLFRVCISVCFI